MGLPGLFSVIAKYEISHKPPPYCGAETVYIVDGNILLYRFFENSSFNFQGFYSFFKNALEKYNKVFVTFDGNAPKAKILEQVKRRKRREEITSILGIDNPTAFFHITNQMFQCFVLDLERNLNDMGIGVISFELYGEGEQKIYQFLEENENFLPQDIVINSSDWDCFIISAYFIKYKCPKYRIYQETGFCLMDVPSFIKDHEPLEFAGRVIAFGCDFIPGISNTPLDKKIFNYLEGNPPFLILDNGVISLDRKNFINYLEQKKMITNSMENYYKTKAEEFYLENLVNLKTMTELKDIKEKSNEVVSELKTLLGKTFTKFCRGSCISCNPREEDYNINDWLRMYLWSLQYLLRINKRDGGEVSHRYLYRHPVGPPIKKLIDYLKDENNEIPRVDFTNEKYFINEENYKALMQRDVVELPYCYKKPIRYTSQLKIVFVH